MNGQLVCQFHGGLSRQSLESAEIRLRALVHPSLDVFTRALGDYRSDPSLAVRVAQDILDRAGYKAVSTVRADGRMIIEVEYVGGKPTIVDVEPVHANGRPLIEFLPEALEE
jgi:hypothetical protein